MICKQLRIIISVVFILLITASISIFSWSSFQYKLFPSSYTEPIHRITDFKYRIGDSDFEAVRLPYKLTDLAPRTEVILTAEIEVNSGDRLLVKSVFAPMRILINDILIGEYGQNNTFPPFMNDPPTIITTIPLPDTETTATLRIEYLSLTQRSVLSLPVVYTGNETTLLAEQFYQNGLSLLFSLLLLFIGVSMILISFGFVRKVPVGSAFLWLGLSSLTSGFWVFGECDLTGFLLPYPSLLYIMTYIGLFTLVIPFLHFGLVILNPKNKIPIYFMLYLHYISLLTAIVLQLSGKVDFIKSLYWFHFITPAGFVVFAVCLLWEHFKYYNSAARRFAPAILLLTASAILEVLNYWLHMTDMLTLFFQFGVLSFVLSLGIVSSNYVQEAIHTAEEKLHLEYKMSAIDRQLEMQKLQYQKIAGDNTAFKIQRHDLHHQLAVIRDLNSRREASRLDSYISQLIDNIPSEKTIRLCENYAVNAVAAHYFTIAQNKNIDISVELAISEDIGCIQDSDLCIMIGNLLENAIEACQRVYSGRRFIKMRSRIQYDTLTITMDNSFNEELREKNGIFLSSKRKGEGIGLSSIITVAQKYGGTAKFEAKQGVFLSSVYIILAEKNE